MKPGDLIEYAAHEVNVQADGSFLPVGEEQWLPGEVVDVMDHPVPIDTPDAEAHTVVRIAPESGEPPFDLRAKLVRLS